MKHLTVEFVKGISTIHELREVASQLKIRRYSKYHKEDLRKEIIDTIAVTEYYTTLILRTAERRALKENKIIVRFNNEYCVVGKREANKLVKEGGAIRENRLSK